jgi:hypothetical protein
MIHPELASFSIFGTAALKVQVTRERLLLVTEDARFYEVSRDLATGILGLLRHTPAKQLGINLESHFKKENESEWHAFGDALAPKAAWPTAIHQPRLLSISMKCERPDELPGNVIVSVASSLRLAPFGIAVAINDHYEASSASNTDMVSSLLSSNWASSLKRSREIVEHLMKTP